MKQEQIEGIIRQRATAMTARATTPDGAGNGQDHD